MTNSDSYTNLAFVCKDNFERRFHGTDNQEYAFAYEVPYYMTEGERKFITSSQIDKMNDLYVFKEAEINSKDYTFMVNFNNKVNMMSYNKEPDVTIYCKRWEGPLYGVFRLSNYMDDKYYLTDLEPSASFRYVKIPDDIAKDIEDQFFEVFNDAYIENLIISIADKEKKMEIEASNNFFNIKKSNGIINPKKCSPFLERIKEKIKNFIME